MNWYELVVEKGKEEALVQFLRNNLHWNVYFPQMRKHFRIHGEDLLVVKALSNGCVLLESELCKEEISSILKQSLDLSVQLITPIEMEQANLLRELCGNDWILEMSKGIINHGQKKVLDGPLKGKEALIKKINRHKMLCELDIIMNQRTILASLEITEKR